MSNIDLRVAFLVEAAGFGFCAGLMVVAYPWPLLVVLVALPTAFAAHWAAVGARLLWDAAP